MNKLTFENCFLGAKIIKGKDEFYVYKINQKTFYYGKLKYETIKQRWENKSKDLTWKALMENVDAKSSEYQGFYLSEKQEAELLLKKASDEKKEKKYLSSFAEKEIARLYERYKTGKGSWRHQVELSKEVFSIVSAKENGIVLLSYEGSLIFFNLNNKKYTFWRNLGVPKIGRKEEIPWMEAC